MPKIKIDNELYDRIKDYADKAGYSSVDEFVVHTLEKMIEMAGDSTLDDKIKDRLRGLGYLE